MRDFLRSWLPVAVWALLIYASSTSHFGNEQTSRFIIPALQWLLPAAPITTLDLIHEFIRKSAHFVDYFILGLLLYRALRGQARGWVLRCAILAVLLASGYAASDEYHQSFEAGRGSSARDALLDTVGASAAQAALWAFLRPRGRIAPAAPARG